MKILKDSVVSRKITTTSAVVYLAHPISGNVEANLVDARKWIREIYEQVPYITVLAHWIVDCEVLDESNPRHRGMGLAHDFNILERCDELWILGEHVSAGMSAEITFAKALGIPIRKIATRAEIANMLRVE